MRMRLNRVVIGTLAGLTFMFQLFALVMPMHVLNEGGFRVTTDVHGAQSSFDGQSFSEKWTSSEFDEEEGISELRIAGPLMITAVVFAGVGFLLTLTRFVQGVRPQLAQLGLIAFVVAFVFALPAFVLYNVGIDALSEGEIPDSFDKGAGWVFAIMGFVGVITTALATMVRTDMANWLLAPLEEGERVASKE